MASQEDTVLTYKASDMVLAIHGDASYLSEPKARSLAGGHMFMSSSDDIPTTNGAVLNISHVDHTTTNQKSAMMFVLRVGAVAPGETPPSNTAINREDDEPQ